MHFLYWGGPVYCITALDVRWQEPTYVFCNPLAGATNTDFYLQLSQQAGTNDTPLGVLLRMAESRAQKAGIDFRASTVGGVGFAGFSAYHQFINPLLKHDGDRARVNYLQLSDACFLGAGATSPHQGFAKYMLEAATESDPTKLMIITSHGPRGDIHYSGPDGHRYDLTSGTSCVQLSWNYAMQNGASEDSTPPEVPPGLPKPDEAHRSGHVLWFGYDHLEHEVHVNKMSQPLLQAYASPWLAQAGKCYTGKQPVSCDDPELPGEGGASIGSMLITAGKVLAIGGAVGGFGYSAWRFYKSRRKGETT